MSDDRYRFSFDAAAERYERARSGYAEDAVEWIAGRLPFGRVLDLAAGTGKLTRQVVARGAEVVAVEPGDAMRGVLERVVPGARVLAGSAEAIPLPDASVDAVTVGQAFHWFRTGEALREMHRVLRPGGGYALLWNEWDLDDPLASELNALLEALRPDGMRDELDAQKAELAGSPLFGALEERTFPFAERLGVERLVERVASVSVVAVAPAEEQARVEARVRELAGSREVDLPVITSVVVADRV